MRVARLRFLGSFVLLLIWLTGMAAVPSLPAKAETCPCPPHQGTLSLNFQNINIRTLIQLIAKNSGANLIISDSVKGEMSLSLKQVTWQQALAIVLKANALGERRYGNVLIIGPVDELAANEIKTLQAQQQLAELTPLVSKIVRLNYANATDLAAVIKGQSSTLLSPRGQIGVDARTNSLWIRDIQANIDQVDRFIAKLDIPAKQVMIEARIVSIESEYAKNLGVRFGWTTLRHLSGTLPGANKIANDTEPGDVPIDERLNFNLPAGPIFTSQGPARIALALYKMGSSYLDLELSALEGEQHAELISNPRIITANQQKAHIQTGEDIPYQEATSSGATSITFKQAVLGLEITPQITPDNKIVLNVKVNQDSQGSSINTGGGVVIPIINTQEVESNIFLNDGETVVIGGVYKRNNQHNIYRIPFFASLPLIGNLFRHTEIDDAKSELLVFLTPKIIKQPCLTRDERRVECISRTAEVY